MQNNFDNIDKNNNNGEKPIVSFEEAWAALKPALDKEAERRTRRKKRIISFLFSFLVLSLVGGIVLMNNRKLPSSTTSFSEKSALPNIKSNIIGSSLPIIVGNTIIHHHQQNKGTKKSTTLQSENKEGSFSSNVNSNMKAELGNYQQKNKPILTDNQLTEVQKAKYPLAQKGRMRDNSTSVASKNTPTNHVSIVENNKLSTNLSDTQMLVNQPIVQINKTTSYDKPAIKKDTINQGVRDTTTLANSIAKNEKVKSKRDLFHFGLEFSVPIQAGINTLDINGAKQPLSLLIPQIWGSLNLTDKQTLLLSVNPYSTYYFNNKTPLNTTTYQTTIQHAATLNNNPESINYEQVVAINKLIVVQAAILYQYQLSSKLKVGVGVGINFLQGAIFKEKIFKNNTLLMTDDMYGIGRNSKEWSLLKSNFMNSRFELSYQFKNADIGLNINTPIGDVVTSTISNTSFFNPNLFLRWRLK